MIKKLLSILLLFSFSSCAVGPDYKRPNVKTPAQHRGDSLATQQSFADLNWWDVFKDPALKNLIDEALKNNFDLRIATLRVEQIRELARIKKADFYPQFNYSATDNYGEGVITQGLPAGNRGNMAVIGAQMQWELDVWGRVRRASQSAMAQYFSSIEAMNAVTIMLVAEVAKAYFELRALDKQLVLAKDTAKAFEGIYKIFSSRKRAGTASLLESSRAGSAWAQALAVIPQVEAQIVEKENHINFLLGRAPATVVRGGVLNSQYIPPQIPVGLPSALLERRPDIRGAEQDLISANAEIGIAKADFFPKFSLTGLLGVASPDLKTFSNSWSIGGNLTGPIFNAGKISGNYQAKKRYYEQVALNYEKTILTALKEVSDLLSFKESLVYMIENRSKATEFLRKAVKLSLDRYSAGLANYIEVLDAQQELYPAENDLINAQKDQLVTVVQLYKALGGGWSTNSEVKILDKTK